MVSAADLPKCCKEETIRSSANTNSTSVPRIYNTLRMLPQGGCEWVVMGAAGSNTILKKLKIREGFPETMDVNNNLIRHYCANSCNAIQAISPGPMVKASSSMLNVGVCTYEIMPLASLRVPMR